MADAILCVSGIYAIRNTINDKRYVGSSKNILERWQQHVRLLKLGTHHSQKLQRAWLKYGAEAFSIELLEVVLDLDSLVSCEQLHIDAHGSVVGGYNISPTAGSVRGIKRSEETKQLMSESMKRRGVSQDSIARLCSISANPTPETRRRMSEAHKGVPLSAAHRAQMAKARAKVPGRPHSEETKQKLRELNSGKPMNLETRAKISQSLAGRKKSPEARANMVIARRSRGQKEDR